MFGIDDAILGGLAGSAIGGLASFFGQREANQANIGMSREQMDFQRRQNIAAMDFSADQAIRSRAFQERMSNSAWQRGVEDMRKAGINPMLSVSQGGASVPPGASASGVSSSGSQAHVENAFAGIGKSVSSAISLAMLKGQLENLQKTNQKIDSDIAVNKQNVTTAKQLAGVYDANKTATNLENTRRKNVAEVEATGLGKYGAYVRFGADLLGDVIGAASPFGSIGRSLRGLGDFTHTRQGSVYNRRTGEVSGG